MQWAGGERICRRKSCSEIYAGRFVPVVMTLTRLPIFGTSVCDMSRKQLNSSGEIPAYMEFFTLANSLNRL